MDIVGQETLEVMRKADKYNRWILSFLRPHLRGKILEIGAGIGNFSKLLSDFGEVTAIDFNKDYISELKKQNINAFWGDIEKGEYKFSKSYRFDTIISLNVLEHIKEDQKSLVNAHKLLNPGGKLLLLTPAHRQAYSVLDKNLGHYRRYTKKSLAKKIKSVGFEVKDVRYLNLIGLLGWYVSGKIMGKDQLSTSQLKIFDIVSTPLLMLEKLVRLPLGLSVFVVAQMPKVKKDIKKISIIIPVYNEEKTLKEILKKVKNQKLSKNLSKEIIVVDDGSIDQSAKIAKSIKQIKLIQHKKNKGKGAAIITGLKNATGDVVIIQDADLEYNPKYYNNLVKPIIDGKTNVVYGTRLRKLKLELFGEKKTLHPQNYIANRFLSSLTNLLFGTRLTDMETCYKVFRREIINPKSLNSMAFEIEPEITALIAKQKEKIIEIDITVTPRDYHEGKKIKPIDGLYAIQTLLKERFIR